MNDYKAGDRAPQTNTFFLIEGIRSKTKELFGTIGAQLNKNCALGIFDVSNQCVYNTNAKPKGKSKTPLELPWVKNLLTQLAAHEDH